MGRYKTYWETLTKKFEKPIDIPTLPKPQNEDEWVNFYVKKLIQLGAIPKIELVDGCDYYGKCRNNNKATWRQDKNCFEYEREKFGNTYIDTINHFEDDNGYDLFVPLKRVD